MRLPINIFGNLQFLKGDFFDVSGSDSTISQRIAFSCRNVLKNSNPVAKLVFKKLSIYTMKTSKMPFLCLLKKLGCQRKWIRKTFLNKIFDKLSDFESRNLIRVKFKSVFANNFRFRIKSFRPHQISKTICFFPTHQILKKTLLWKVQILELFTTKKRQNWRFCVSFDRMNLRKKLEWQIVFETYLSLRVRLPTNIFTTRQFSNENI